MATNMELLNAMRGLAGTAGAGAQMPVPQKPSFQDFLGALLTGQDPSGTLPTVNSPFASLVPSVPPYQGSNLQTAVNTGVGMGQVAGNTIADAAALLAGGATGSQNTFGIPGQTSTQTPDFMSLLSGLMSPLPAPASPLADAQAAKMVAGVQAPGAGVIDDATAALIDQTLAQRETLDTEALKGALPQTLSAKKPIVEPATPPKTGTGQPATPEQIVEQVQKGEIGPSKEFMNSLPEEDKGFLAGLMDNEEFMVPFMMAMSLFSGRNYDEAAMSGLQARQGILNRKERKEDKAAAKEASAAAAQLEQDKLKLEGRKVASTEALNAAKIKEANANAQKSLSDAVQATKPINDQQYAKLITDQIAAIEANNTLADVPVADPQFQATYVVNAALPPDARRKIPFNANEQERLKTVLSDPNTPEADARTEIQKALVVYGEDIVKAWLNTL